MALNQYDIILVNLDPTIGSVIKKTRPCLILSPNEMNKHLHTVIVAPMTTTSKPYPTRVALIHDGKQGAAAIDQIRTIDKRRIIRVLGRITTNEVKRCKAIIKETFVD